jgi:hypothetical protein
VEKHAVFGPRIVADYIAPSNADDGLAVEIETLLTTGS